MQFFHRDFKWCKAFYILANLCCNNTHSFSFLYTVNFILSFVDFKCLLLPLLLLTLFIFMFLFCRFFTHWMNSWMYTNSGIRIKFCVCVYLWRRLFDEKSMVVKCTLLYNEKKNTNSNYFYLQAFSGEIKRAGETFDFHWNEGCTLHSAHR